MHQQVDEIVEARDSLAQAVAIGDPAERAEALQKFVRSPRFRARMEAFDALGKGGEDALPVLRKMLRDSSLADYHGHVIEALLKAGGPRVGAELTDIVGEELQFWKQTAPRLHIGWWNGAGLDQGMNGTEVLALRNRYVKVHNALLALKQLRYEGSAAVVTELRDYWRSMPQLDDRSGLDQMSQTCDELLLTLQRPRRGKS